MTMFEVSKQFKANYISVYFKKDSIHKNYTKKYQVDYEYFCNDNALRFVWIWKKLNFLKRSICFKMR